MLQVALTCVALAVLAGLLGFTGVAEGAVGALKFIFDLFLVLFLVSLAARAFTDSPTAAS